MLKLVKDHKVGPRQRYSPVPEVVEGPKPFSQEEKVSIRKLLTYTAGTSISEELGKDKSDMILTSLMAKRHTSVKLDTIPGTGFFYSGGEKIILQQLIEDVNVQIHVCN